MRNLFYIFLVVIFSITRCSYAAVTETPGDGIDDSLYTGGAPAGTIGACPAGFIDSVFGTSISTPPAGCDHKCAVPDEDCDGFTNNASIGRAGVPYLDPDDHDRTKIPGDYYGCDAGTGPNSGYKFAHRTAGYQTCVANNIAPLCEATLGGTCKYVQCAGGNDSAAGDFTNPYLTFGKVSGGAGGAPGGAVTLATGSVVYLLGGTCSSGQFSTGSGPFLGEFVNSGITVKSYPGGTGNFNLVNINGFLAGANATFAQLSFTGSCTGAGAGTIPIYQLGTGHSGVEVRLNVFDTWTGSSFNNNSMIYLSHTNTSNIHHNYFSRWGQGSGACNNPGNGANTHGLQWLSDPGGTEGANHSAYFNVFIQPVPVTSATAGAGINFKHGVRKVDAGVNGTQEAYNYYINTIIAHNGSALRAHHNVLNNPSTGLLYISGGGAGEPNQDNQFYNNTAIYTASSGLGWVPTYSVNNESLVWHDNVILNPQATYASGNHEGVVDIDAYGSAVSESQLRTNNGGTGSLFGTNNCYYNSLRAPNFAYFSVGNATPKGGNYNFGQWTTLTGPVTSPAGSPPQQTDVVGSLIQDPVLNAFWEPTSVGCTGRGAFAGGSPPTPTPTPTPTVIPGLATAKMPRIFTRGR